VARATVYRAIERDRARGGDGNVTGLVELDTSVHAK
jgi:hypothetical protein